MRRLVLACLAAGLAQGAAAQTPDPHAGHQMAAPPTPAADPHAGHRMVEPAAPQPDPHAGHHRAASPAPAADPHAGHQMPDPAASPPDPHAGHPGPVDPEATVAQLPVGDAPAPPPPTQWLADGAYGRDGMDRARALLRQEHGGSRFSLTMLDNLELRPGAGGDVYAWEGEFRYGGDIHRLVLKSEGEGRVDGALEQAEVQALYSRATTRYFDLQAGVRQDLQPGPHRTYAAVGVEGLAPYWFGVEATAFLSNQGELSARIQGSYDLRLTQRLILQPRAELNLAASDVPELGVGAGVSSAELGLRLRYEIRREFAPYVGVHYQRSFGDTAAMARAAGDDAGDVRAMVGLRAWF